MIVSQEKKYVSIYIAPTVDLTETLEPGEKGVVCAIGSLSFGNPYKPVILGSNPEKPKTTNPNFGGSQDNETAYHIQDYFAGFKGKFVLGRVLGDTSTTKVLTFAKQDDGTITMSETDINIFGANNIEDWKDTPNTDDLAIVINSCFSEKHSIELNYIATSKELTFKLFDRNGNKVYEVVGSVDVNSEDDDGNPNYIGMLANESIVTIKANGSAVLFSADWNFAHEFTNGLVTESGNKNYAKAIEVISSYVEKADYVLTAGLRDKTTIVSLKGLCYDGKTPFIVDVYGKTLQDAVNYKNNLGIADELCIFIWNREKDKFDFGVQEIGLSGWFAGQTVKKNLSNMRDDIESRVEGVAGVDYQVPREKANDLPNLTDEELTSLVDNRINTVRIMQDKLVLGDVLSGYPKWSALRLFPVVEAKVFLDKYIARIIEQKMFKNTNEAKRFVKDNVRIMFEKAKKADYFDNDADTQYWFNVSVEDSDKIVVNYECVIGGVVRRGKIQGTIAKKITK